METKTLEILADAISDIGSWQWWDEVDDIFQLEFSDVLMFDETMPEGTSRASVIALRFSGNAFAVFLDNFEEKSEKEWWKRFYDDEIGEFEITVDDVLKFDDVELAGSLLDRFKNTTPMKRFDNPQVFSSTKHILAGTCGDVGFVVGGDNLVVIGNKGEFSEEEIEEAAKRWWDYWREYWRLRGTPGALAKDWLCEVTIPINPNSIKGKFSPDL